MAITPVLIPHDNFSVPGKIVARVGSSRWFPGEFLKRWVWPVVKTTVTSPQEREMQVRILPRELCPRS